MKVKMIDLVTGGTVAEFESDSDNSIPFAATIINIGGTQFKATSKCEIFIDNHGCVTSAEIEVFKIEPS